MYKTLYKKLILILAGFVLLFLIGCGENNNTPQNSGNKKQNKITATTTSLEKGNPVKGKDLFMQSCSACHGTNAKGLPKLGKDLTTSKFAIEKTDEQLLEYIKVGRTPADPLNTTGVAMPPKGGNPALTDQQIMDIIAYVRTLETPEHAK